jgi:hypothetical protein
LKSQKHSFILLDIFGDYPALAIQLNLTQTHKQPAVRTPHCVRQQIHPTIDDVFAVAQPGSTAFAQHHMLSTIAQIPQCMCEYLCAYYRTPD